MDGMIVEVKKLDDFLKLVREGELQVFLHRDEAEDSVFVLPPAPYPLIFGCKLPLGGWKDLEDVRAMEARVV